ncbi:putative cytochrome P450 [Pseudovirgaria hyperparasitica]|uniref:Putative cytochrome P450 n=1 Tax=Pseudovirgaria hyperparasitica TaxID=470096 RepID=A0A6A6WBH8_9PEZI|nr:putative cytochrome P450 [Pseudovirgaria hyperparasitica]KAF2758957.1 putative cytochrome P450 [Pseudovirgaria hyperparasitica]
MSSLHTSLAAALVAWLFYLLVLTVYRLFFHPLARFPGPAYAAVSRWHEWYYDVYLGGKLIFWIEHLHKVYGPIVRITPDEVHILDADLWETLYTKAGRVDKYQYMSPRFGNENSVLTTAPDALHRIRRNALNPFFSRQRIVDLQTIIKGKLDILIRKVQTAKTNGQPIVISRGFQAFAEDVIMNYTFAHDYDSLNKQDWKPILHDSFQAVSISGNMALQFPWIPKILNALPKKWLAKIEPLYDLIFRMQAIKALKSGMSDERIAKAGHTTILSELLRGDLPAEELSNLRLQDEAQLIIGAGLATTGWTLSLGIYYILSNPNVLHTLRKELNDAIPEANLRSPSQHLDWTKLERLPYLMGCVREAVRLSYSTTSRNARIFKTPIQFGDWSIPAGTPISMTIPFLNHNEEIFPNSYAFVPERWIGNPKAPNGSSLERYFVGFGKGSRSCLGINLAQAELYLTFAAMIRYFDLELFDTDKTDVDMAHDFFLPFPKLDSKGIRVLVKDDKLYQ